MSPPRRIILTLRLFAFAGAMLLLLPVQAAAADVRGQNNATIGPGQTITDDLYLFGNTVAMQGTVEGDLVGAGGTVNISGRVTRDLLIAGGTINISGPVDGSVRIAGGNISITGPVTGDVLVAGGTLTLGSEATVGRDLLLAAGTATVSAPVHRNVKLGTGTVTLENTVGGNVTGSVDKLTLASGAKIDGSLDYTSRNAATIDAGATIAGPVTRHTPVTSTTSPGGAGLGFIGWLRGLIGISLLGLLLVLLFPGFGAKAVEALEHRPGASLGFGAAILVITPIVAIVAFIVGLIVGGWWLALLLFPAYILALALGYVVSGLLIGRWVAHRFDWQLHPAWIVLAGLFGLAVVGLIPVLGAIVSFIAVLFGLGALTIAVTSRPTAAQTA